MKNGKIPYVVSEDIQILLKQWARQNSWVKLPPPEFFTELRRRFANGMRQIFPAFEVVPEPELQQGIKELTKAVDLPLVSLDNAYVEQADFWLDFSREVDSENNELHGPGQRQGRGTNTVVETLWKLKASGVRDVALVDDVIFTGELVRYVIELLAEKDIIVREVIAGVGIEAGLTRITTARSLEINCVRIYSEVIDQICERDFYPGTPLSGRTVKADDYDNVGAPYLYPLGKPQEWASIPKDRAVEFSLLCLGQAIALWQAVGDASSRVITCVEVPRGVKSLTRCDRSFVTELERAMERIG